MRSSLGTTGRLNATGQEARRENRCSLPGWYGWESFPGLVESTPITLFLCIIANYDTATLKIVCALSLHLGIELSTTCSMLIQPQWIRDPGIQKGARFIGDGNPPTYCVFTLENGHSDKRKVFVCLQSPAEKKREKRKMK